MSAFAAALEGGAHGVELDVMMTADRQLVVFHDYTLQKRLPLQGVVRKMTLQELRKVDLSLYFQIRTRQPAPASFRNTPAPLLEDVLQYYQKHPKAILNIEMKNEDISDKGHEQETYRLVQKYKMEDRVIVSSFNPFSMWRFRRIAPNLRRGLIYSKDTAFYLRDLWLISLARPDALHPNFKIVDEAYMHWARKHGFSVNVWTVNEEKDMQRMIRLGVDAIITDYPQRLLRVAKQERTAPRK
jgi:glycerophosphoryl diester phosphodiesterase